MLEVVTKTSLTEDLTLFFQKTPHTVLVPMPMFWYRKALRGYNHAERIARIYGEALKVDVRTDILKRITHTKQQAKSIGRVSRLENIRGAFALEKHTLPHDVVIILVDDVVTTGATIHEATRILNQAGYLSVYSVTLAH